MISPRRILLVALVTQGALIALAWWSARTLGIPPQWGQPVRDTAIGLAVAAVLALGNYWLLTRAPANWVSDGVRHVYHSTIVPLFGGLHPLGVVAIGAAAGVGEEWLFRGVLQPLVGLVASSVLFGVAHVGGSRMLPFGVWATVMGLVMGGLAVSTGGLIAPIVAHGVYDMLALEYIRRGAQST
jgi:membrane protease YdiL (CAAX protease family)